MQPDQSLPTPEKLALQVPTPEKPATVERPGPAPVIEQAKGVGSSVVATPTSTAQPVPPAAAAAAQSSTAPADPSLAQLPAEDADVIEKVWVEKSDEIIESKKDDPRAEDDAQHNLSRAYLKKRFNLDVD